MRFAIIESGTIKNIVSADVEFAALHGWIECSDQKIGDLYQGGQFVSAPHKDPEKKLKAVDVIGALNQPETERLIDLLFASGVIDQVKSNKLKGK